MVLLKCVVSFMTRHSTQTNSTLTVPELCLVNSDLGHLDLEFVILYYILSGNYTLAMERQSIGFAICCLWTVTGHKVPSVLVSLDNWMHFQSVFLLQFTLFIYYALTITTTTSLCVWPGLNRPFLHLVAPKFWIEYTLSNAAWISFYSHQGSTRQDLAIYLQLQFCNFSPFLGTWCNLMLAAGPFCPFHPPT